VSEDILSNAFKKFTSFAKCKVVRDKKTEKSKGFGFVSLMDSEDYIKAMREMNGKYVGNRPIKLLPSKWTNKSLEGGYGIIKQGNKTEDNKL
jgi:RNA recognition motif-containing protein